MYFPNAKNNGKSRVCVRQWYVGSEYFANFRGSKTAVLTILEALNFDFWKNVTLENVESFKSKKFRPAQMVNMAVFGASK